MRHLKLGATKVYAVDIDPQAIIATEENAKRNQVMDERLQIGLPELVDGVKVDIVVANILAGPLESLSQQISDLCQTHAKLALSGLLASQANSVRQTYREWFDMDEPTYLDEWTRLTGVKK